jgi:hypothetical protein
MTELAATSVSIAPVRVDRRRENETVGCLQLFEQVGGFGYNANTPALAVLRVMEGQRPSIQVHISPPQP